MISNIDSRRFFYPISSDTTPNNTNEQNVPIDTTSVGSQIIPKSYLSYLYPILPTDKPVEPTIPLSSNTTESSLSSVLPENVANERLPDVSGCGYDNRSMHISSSHCEDWIGNSSASQLFVTGNEFDQTTFNHFSQPPCRDLLQWSAHHPITYESHYHASSGLAIPYPVLQSDPIAQPGSWPETAPQVSLGDSLYQFIPHFDYMPSGGGGSLYGNHEHFPQDINHQNFFGLETIDESQSQLSPAPNHDLSNIHCHLALPDYNMIPHSHTPVVTGAPVKTGQSMQNVHEQCTHLNLSSALTADVTSISPSLPSLPLPSRTTRIPKRPTRIIPPSTRVPTTSLSLLPCSSSSTPPVPSFESASPYPSSSPPKELEDKNDIPGLCKRIGPNQWQCMYSNCKTVTHSERDRLRHVGKHAKEEERLISAGRLRQEDTIAMPRRKMAVYQCDIPDCRYIEQHGRPFRVENYRVDALKARHLQRFHPEIVKARQAELQRRREERKKHIGKSR